MRIGFFSNSVPDGFVGGTERVLAAQARELRALGHDVHHFHEVPALDTLDIELAHVHQWSTFEWDRVRRLAERIPVVLSLHDHFASCARSFRSACGGANCPTSEADSACVECVSSLLGEAESAVLEESLRERWRELRADVLAASAVVCPSEHLRDSLSTELEVDPRDWLVVPHGLCADGQAVPHIRSGDHKLTVLSFGNRASVKGCLDLVRAMAQLPARSARLIFAGEELEAGLDERLREAAGHLDLEIHGRYDESDLAGLAAVADLCAFPSLAEESYGLVLEEALSLGVPAWVSDRGALGELLSAYGSSEGLPGAILPADSVEAWTGALRHLVEFPATLQDARALLPVQPRTAAQAARTLESIYFGALRPLTAPGP